MTNVTSWGWIQPGTYPGWSAANDNNLNASGNGLSLSVANYRTVILHDANANGTISDMDGGDGSATAAGESFEWNGTQHTPDEIAAYTGCTMVADGQTFTNLTVAVFTFTDGTWMARLLDTSIPANIFSHEVTSLTLGTWNGTEYGSVNTSSIDKPLCFAGETPIRTPSGWRRADALRPGDRVVTRDHGALPLLFTHQFQLARPPPAQAPVLIPQGAFGAQVDICLSPLHRVALTLPEAELFVDSPQVLVTARHLAGIAGVRRLDLPRITYVHLMTDPHSLLRTPGLWCESFLPGPWAMRQLPLAAREELRAHLGPLPRMRHVLPTLSAGEVILLRAALERHARDGPGSRSRPKKTRREAAR